MSSYRTITGEIKYHDEAAEAAWHRENLASAWRALQSVSEPERPAAIEAMESAKSMCRACGPIGVLAEFEVAHMGGVSELTKWFQATDVPSYGQVGYHGRNWS